MSRFVIFVNEVHQQAFDVEAENRDDAIRKFRNGRAQLRKDGLTYVKTLDDEIKVEKAYLPEYSNGE